jgi:hypothetical protein
MPGLLARGVLIGDIRITIRDPTGRFPDREIEGVQKIHRIGGNIAMGFAGNIETALWMIWDAARNVNHGMPESAMLNQPSRFLFHWTRRLRWVWDNHLSERQKAGGVALLWMGALPTTNELGFGTTMAWIVRSPGLVPERVEDRTAGAIGSGANVDEYAAELYEIEQEFPNLVQFEAYPWTQMGGTAFALGVAISAVLHRHAVPGISQHLVICSVRWGEIAFTTNDRTGFGPEAPTLVMPPIATTWAEWQAFKQQHGLADMLALG